MPTLDVDLPAWLAEPLTALAYAALVALAFAPLEHVFGSRRARTSRSWLTDLAFATVGASMTRLLLFVGLGWGLARVGRLSMGVGLGAASGFAELPLVVRLLLGLLLFELCGYGYHRLAHRVPALWRLHAVHHSAPTLDWLASFRQHPLEIGLMTLAQNLPLVLLGLPLGEHGLLVMLLSLNTVFVHSTLRMPRWLGWLVATPRFHHRHHDAHAKAANFATLFPWLDRLFGTHDDAEAGPVGLPEGSDAGFWALLLGRTRDPDQLSSQSAERGTLRR